MKKIIRLTENDLSRIISNIIEQTQNNYQYILTSDDVESQNGSTRALLFTNEGNTFNVSIQKKDTNRILPTNFNVPRINDIKQICVKGSGDEPWDFHPIDVSEESKNVANLLFSDQQRTSANYILFLSNGVPAIGKMSIAELPEDVLISKGKRKTTLKNNKIIGLNDYFFLEKPMNIRFSGNKPKLYSYLTINNVKTARPA